MADMVPHEIEPAKGVGGAAHDRRGRNRPGADRRPGRWARPPAAVISPTTASTPAWSMSTTPTAAPSRAKRNAPARPIPEAAAVTMPILPSSRMVLPPRSASSAGPSRGDAFAVVERAERLAIDLADRVALDLQGWRHLAVGDREWLGGDHEAPHPLDRRQPTIDPRHRGADRLDQAGSASAASRRQYPDRGRPSLPRQSRRRIRVRARRPRRDKAGGRRTPSPGRFPAPRSDSLRPAPARPSRRRNS